MASRTSKTTTVTSASAVAPDEYGALRAALEKAQEGHFGAEVYLQDVYAEEVTDDELAPFAAEFIRQGALKLAQQKATAQVQAADRAITVARRELTDAQRKMADDSVRLAELAAGQLASFTSATPDYLGKFEVSAVGGSEPDHAGLRSGSVLVTVTDPGLSHRMLTTALRGLLEGPSSTVQPESEYVYVWSLRLTDPEIVAANRERDKAEWDHEAVVRAQYTADHRPAE